MTRIAERAEATGQLADGRAPGLGSLLGVLSLVVVAHVGGSTLLCYWLLDVFPASTAVVTALLVYWTARNVIVLSLGGWIRSSFYSLGEQHDREDRRLSLPTRLFIESTVTLYYDPLAAYDQGKAASKAAREARLVDLTLLTVGERRIPVMMALRQCTQLDLRQAKAFLDEAPARVVSRVPAIEAERLKAAFESAGATVAVEASAPGAEAMPIRVLEWALDRLGRRSQ